MLKDIKRIRGISEEVKVAIIFFIVSGPVKILLLNRKKFAPSHDSNELMNYINIYFELYS